LLLPRDERVWSTVSRARSSTPWPVIPLDAADLVALLTVARPGPRPEARQFGDAWQWCPSTATSGICVASHPAPWQLVATCIVRRQSALARRIPRIARRASPSDPDHQPRGERPCRRAFDLQLALSQVEINMPLGAELFTVQIPASAGAITLDELRRSGRSSDGADGR